METNGTVDVAEASAALTMVADSRARVAWRGYPTWYWPVTGANLGALASVFLLPDGWDMAATVAIAVLQVVVARIAGRARGVCEGCVHNALSLRDNILLYGPAALLMILGAIASKFLSLSPVVTSVLVFALISTIGLIRGGRAGRW